ncbi:MAG: hypothetical protein IPH93_06530 [Saprospiraceae bacterium]|nr:hypothetical protein [Saprospiraceae bacterium]
MWYYLKFGILFLLMCFFILPIFRIEDPFRTISLQLFSKTHKAKITEHICNPDRIYWYEYDLGQSHYRQRYDGYVATLDDTIPADQRCQGQILNPPNIDIKYFPLFAYWSEPVNSIATSIFEIWMFLLIKIIAIFLILWTFIRK